MAGGRCKSASLVVRRAAAGLSFLICLFSKIEIQSDLRGQGYLSKEGL